MTGRVGRGGRRDGESVASPARSGLRRALSRVRVGAGRRVLAVVLLATLLTTAPVAADAADPWSQGRTHPPAPDDGAACSPEWDTEPTTGRVRLPVLLATFPDAEPSHDPSAVESLLFGEDPDVASGPGSVADYYRSVTGGRLSLAPGPEGVSDWLTVDVPRSEAEGQGARIVEQAVRRADEAGYDFSGYDNDDDGCVSVVVFYQGTRSGAVWPYQNTLSADDGGDPVTADGVTVQSFTLQPVAEEDGLSTIATPTHEAGHLFGLPDLYEGAGVDGWGVMGTGSTGGVVRTGDSPTHPVAWSKSVSDWAGETTVAASGRPGILPPTERDSEVYRIDPAADTDEYYLLQYRERIGFDRGLDFQKTGGLLAWRVSPPVANGSAMDYSVYPGEGGTFDADTDSLARLTDGRDSGVVLSNVTEAYGSVLFDSPPHETRRAGDRAVYAVPVGTTLPNGTRVPRSGALDARVSWAHAEDRIDLTLRGPNGERVPSDPSGPERPGAAAGAPSAGGNATFAVARTGPEPSRGGWKLVTDVGGSGEVPYYRATTYPTYPLPTALDVSAATGPVATDETLSVTVSVAAGGEPYDPRSVAAPNASQFRVALGNDTVSPTSVEPVAGSDGRYALSVPVPDASGGDRDLAVSLTREVVGVSTTVNDTADDPVRVVGEARLPPVGESDALPTDPDGDGLFEDVDGDGTVDTGDMRTLFWNLDDPAVTEHADRYDFSDNGKVDVGDVVAQFDEASAMPGL